MDAESLKREIAITRSALGETVDALAAKADIRGRAKERATAKRRALRARSAQLKDQTGQNARLRRKEIAAAGAGTVAVSAAAWILARRRTHRH
ncbi:MULTISPECIES: DUF3618 domain-containing protein [Thermomonosporaceae]|uniref:DUF3618 domain-containing protein n=1 Tax=Thermomonosporaceae TaxID=2012 RepID=UPI00255B1EC5|nr:MULTISPECIES: DUF3618 domain-containing protein [Thermomonosporaceae]MDL4777103.1 DUF3618 domain-containing protein [Actinomadura xylanilytica]